MLPENLNYLGSRIAIIGPSNSGKSTLSVSLADALKAPHLHLDQIAHRHGTNWERVPDEEFVTRHDDFIKRDAWVMEGNYSICMPRRFIRATAVIWLDPPLRGCIWRYVKRSLQPDSQRAGNLPGARGEFNSALIKYTLINYPKNRRKYRDILKNYPHLKVMVFKKLVSLGDLYG